MIAAEWFHGCVTTRWCHLLIGNRQLNTEAALIARGHHSLVTPIDWKPDGQGQPLEADSMGSHHSLVTPIDWKPPMLNRSARLRKVDVTTCW